MRSVKIILAGFLVAVGLMALTGCQEDNAQTQRNKSVETRARTFARAERKVPIPRTVNFPLRKALAEFTERQDQENHPWFIYIVGDNGNTIGYYVGKTVPVNSCNFLSSTEDYDNGVVLTAPSLDGIFYGGGGASAGCDSWFFFDVATNALVQIRGMDFFAVDQPLKLEAKPIRIKANSK